MNGAAQDPGLGPALQRRLRLFGPINLAEYMRLAMVGGGKGYYVSHSPIGAEGDFVTAPEISQMFGELLGFWCVDAWRQLGRPDPFVLAELGPGRGTLMADLLRAAAVDRAFLHALRLHLVEVSEPLRATQRSALARHSPTWLADFTELPPGPAIILGNEFLDVFPVHQFQMTEAGWKERAICSAGEGLKWALVPPGPQIGMLAPAHRTARTGDIAEVNPSAISFVGAVSRRLMAQGGGALFIDYGLEKSMLGNSLRAVKRHRPVDPLDHFGSADLSAHVDFAMLASAAAEIGLRVQGPISQGAFLRNLGIETRARRLCEDADAGTVSEIGAATERLTSPHGMGTVFKALALRQPGAPELAGFA